MCVKGELRFREWQKVVGDSDEINSNRLQALLRTTNTSTLNTGISSKSWFLNGYMIVDTHSYMYTHIYAS